MHFYKTISKSIGLQKARLEINKVFQSFDSPKKVYFCQSVCKNTGESLCQCLPLPWYHQDMG